MTTTFITASDYNLIQQKVNSVLGTNSLGYGQTLSSEVIRINTLWYGQEVPSEVLITRLQWNALRSDLLRCRWHQTGVEDPSELPLFPVTESPPGYLVTMSDKTLFVNMANTVYTNRLATLPISQSASPTVQVFSYTPVWNNTLELSVTVTFSSYLDMLYYFNTSSELRFICDIIYTLPDSEKTLLWKAFLESIGTIKMNHSTTICTGNGYISLGGFRALTASNMLVCDFPMTSLLGNSFKMYAKVNTGTSPTQVIFTFQFIDTNAEGGDENVAGILSTSLIAYHAVGYNVAVLPPTAFGRYTGGTAVTYTIGQNKTVIDETISRDITFTVLTTGVGSGVLQYSVVSTQGAVNTDDLSSMTGTITLDNNGTASFMLSALNDHVIEGMEKFQVQLRTPGMGGGFYNGTVVAVSQEISITDTSVPEYRIVNDPAPTLGYAYSLIDETIGRNITFKIYTVGVGNTPLYYTLSGAGITAGDFSTGVINGTITMASDYGSVSFVTSTDLVLEGIEEFVLQLRIDSINGEIVKESTPVRILDTSVPTYTITTVPVPVLELDRWVTIINEDTNSNIGFYIDTTGVPDGTTLYYKLDGTGVTAGDFDINSGGGILGSVVIDANGHGDTQVKMAADYTAEETEYFNYRLYTDAARTVEVAVSINVKVLDTSVPTYTVYPDVYTEVNETTNPTINFRVVTQGVPIGTEMTYSIGAVDGGAVVNSDDFSDHTHSGNFTIGNHGSFIGAIISKTLNADSVTEGSEFFYFNIYRNGLFKARSGIIGVVDTSLTPFGCTISGPNVSGANSGNHGTYTIDKVTGTATGTVTITLECATNVLGSDIFGTGTYTISGHRTIDVGFNYAAYLDVYAQCRFRCTGGGATDTLTVTGLNIYLPPGDRGACYLD